MSRFEVVRRLDGRAGVIRRRVDPSSFWRALGDWYAAHEALGIGGEGRIERLVADGKALGNSATMYIGGG